MSEAQSGHTMRVFLVDEYVRLRLECHELDAAKCHEVCSRCDGDDIECSRHDVEVWQRDDEDLDREHDVISGKDCNAVVWLDNTDVEGLCDMTGEIPLYDGMAVEVTWDGDNWNWFPTSMRIESKL